MWIAPLVYICRALFSLVNLGAIIRILLLVVGIYFLKQQTIDIIIIMNEEQLFVQIEDYASLLKRWRNCNSEF